MPSPLSRRPPRQGGKQLTSEVSPHKPTPKFLQEDFRSLVPSRVSPRLRPCFRGHMNIPQIDVVRSAVIWGIFFALVLLGLKYLHRFFEDLARRRGPGAYGDPEIKRKSWRLVRGFCHEDRDDAIGVALVLLIGRECIHRYTPQSFSLRCIYHLSNSHGMDCGLVANFNIRICL